MLHGGFPSRTRRTLRVAALRVRQAPTETLSTNCFSGTMQDRRCACIVMPAMMRPGQASLQPPRSWWQYQNFQTRALKTKVDFHSPFARTHAFLSWCSVLGWQMGLSLRPCFEREHTCLKPERYGEPCLTRTHFRGGSQRYRRASRSLHSIQQLVSLRIAEFHQFSSGTAKDLRNRKSTYCSGPILNL